MGGSHGGFLVTHLAGQYPDQYQVSSPTLPLLSFLRQKRSVLLSFIFQGVVARNPVTNIARWKTSFKLPFKNKKIFFVKIAVVPVTVFLSIF
jgi:hypothetical protein